MKQHADDRDRGGEAHPDGENAHVLDARIAEEPLQVALAGQVQGREDERGEAEDEKHVARECRADRPDCDLVEAQDGIEAHREQRSGQQGRDRSRCLGVGIGQPGVHRDKAHLRAKPENGETEGQAHDLRWETRRSPEEPRVEELVGPAENRAPCVVHEHGREQCDAEAHGGDEDVLPRGLGGAVGVPDRYEKRRDDRRDLDGNPQQSQPVDDRCHRHRPGEQIEAGKETTRVANLGRTAAGLYVPDSEDSRGHVQECHSHEEDDRERVDAQPSRQGSRHLVRGDQRHRKSETGRAAHERECLCDDQRHFETGKTHHERGDQDGHEDGAHR